MYGESGHIADIGGAVALAMIGLNVAWYISAIVSVIFVLIKLWQTLHSIKNATLTLACILVHSFVSPSGALVAATS